VSRPLVDNFCTTTCHFTSTSTSQDAFFKTTLRIESPSCCQSCTTTRGVELHVKWRVVVQDCQQVDDPICKVVEKKTSCDVELGLKWRVVMQNRQEEDDPLCKFVKKKDVLCRWIRHKVTSCHAKIVKKRMSQCAKLSWKRRLLTLNQINYTVSQKNAPTLKRYSSKL